MEGLNELINRRHRQLLVHSFLYYILNESIINDAFFDRLVIETMELHQQYPEVAANAVYFNICKRFDRSSSGYFIREYPIEIKATACRLLWLRDNSMRPITEYYERAGIQLENHKSKKQIFEKS